MSQLPLILQGGRVIEYAAAETTLKKRIQGEVLTGRGLLKAFFPFCQSASPFDTQKQLYVSFGGSSVLEKTQSQVYHLMNGMNEPGQKYIPIDLLSEGQTFEYAVGLMDQPVIPPAEEPLASDLIFCFEGFSFDYQFQNFTGQRYYGSNKRFVGNETVNYPTITGTVPKDRGKIVGFRVSFGETSFTASDTIKALINLEISGVKVLEKIPAWYFASRSTFLKEFFFEEENILKGGEPYNLTLQINSAITAGFFGIDFIFDGK